MFASGTILEQNSTAQLSVGLLEGRGDSSGSGLDPISLGCLGSVTSHLEQNGEGGHFHLGEASLKASRFLSDRQSR